MYAFDDAVLNVVVAPNVWPHSHGVQVVNRLRAWLSYGEPRISPHRTHDGTVHLHHPLKLVLLGTPPPFTEGARTSLRVSLPSRPVRAHILINT